MAKAATKTQPVDPAAPDVIDREAAEAVKIASVEPALSLRAPPKVRELCGNCSNWMPMSSPALGQCRASAKTMPTMLVTTDRMSCSQWKLLI
jgi:hypothetical protein